MIEAFQHCHDLVRAVDRDRFIATLFAPEVRRSALHALYAFNIEIRRVRELARDPMPGEIRLQWWREVIEGSRREEAAANPVSAALIETMARYSIAANGLIDMIEARAFDIYDDPMQSMTELQSYASKTDAALFKLAAAVLGEVGSEIDVPLNHAGTAQAIAELLRRFPLHAARRQIYVPLEILRRHGAEPEDVLGGKATPELRAVLAEMRVRARRHLTEAGAALVNAPTAIFPALLPLALVRPALGRMERRGYRPFEPPNLPLWQRQWLMWRAARNPRRIFG